MESKKKSFKNLSLFISLLGLLGMQSCAVVPEYKKQKLNDSEMELSSKKSEKFETNFQVYREGASGANGGKAGGGCGCN